MEKIAETTKYEPIIKASPDFYRNLAIKKLEIGMKGELLAMEHERQRLLEGGENPDVLLKHKSVSDGDGFGYDILSFENGKEIYIEVKTTTGSGDTNKYDILKDRGYAYSKMGKRNLMIMDFKKICSEAASSGQCSDVKGDIQQR